MDQRTGLRPQSPPPGHAFVQGSGDGRIPNAQARLITAYRADQGAWPPNHRIIPDELPDVEPTTPLRGDYEQAMTHATHADKEYQRELRSLLQTFPQGEGEVPERPTPERMQVLFKKVLYHDQVRPRGKGSKGGVKHYECKWPDCPYKGPLQKCMDHFFCEHVKLKFFKCDQPNCGITFLRKYDLDKHRKKQHLELRPREQSQRDSGVARLSRHTRSRGPIQYQPYSTQGRSTRGRPTSESIQGDRRVAGPSRQTHSRGVIEHHPYSTGRSTQRRPSIERSQGDRGGAGPSRQTRSRALNQPQPYITQRSTRGRAGSESIQVDRGVAGPSRQRRSRGVVQHQSYSTGQSTQRRPSIERDPRTVSITGTAGLTQTKPSGPLGQFQICLVRPLARFLTMPYTHAHRILQLSRTVHVFHMQSVYIARQAIHLVIVLNDLVDAKKGPDDEQYQERIDLEDELIELFDAMQEWGAKPDDGLQVDYDRGLFKINQQYALFFRKRFYFHNGRNSADDSIYGKLVAYDRRTIDFRKWQYSRPDPRIRPKNDRFQNSMDVDLIRSNNFQPTINPRSTPTSQPGGWEVQGFEEGAEMRIDSEGGVAATDFTP